MKQLTIKKKKDKYVNIVLFMILWGAYCALMLLLFHRQTVNYAGGYESDMKSYVLYIQGVDTGNPYAYPLMFWVAQVFALVLRPQMAVAFAVTGLNALTPLALKIYGDCYIDIRGLYGSEDKKQRKAKIWFTVLLFACLFVSMLFWPFAGGSEVYRYKGVFSPNPFHNATYLAARGFSVISFFSFLELLDGLNAKVDHRKQWKQYVVFGVSLLLTTMTKPSFTLGFGVAAGMVVLVLWLKQGLAEWKRYLWMALAVVPTLFDLLYQYSGVFTGADATGTELGIGFGWLEAWHSCADRVWLSVLLGMAFPLVVLLCNLPQLKYHLGYGFTWAMVAADFLLAACLYEKGWRMWHMNFAWGYMYGMFFAFVMSALILFENTLKKKQKTGVLALQWMGFMLHLICGIIYFVGIMNGGSYV